VQLKPISHQVAGCKKGRFIRLVRTLDQAASTSDVANKN